MFELVEQQPSHLACPDVLNLSLGESKASGRHLGGRALPVLCVGCGLRDAPPDAIPIALDQTRSLVICVWDVGQGRC